MRQFTPRTLKHMQALIDLLIALADDYTHSPSWSPASRAKAKTAYRDFRKYLRVHFTLKYSMLEIIAKACYKNDLKLPSEVVDLMIQEIEAAERAREARERFDALFDFESR